MIIIMIIISSSIIPRHEEGQRPGRWAGLRAHPL